MFFFFVVHSINKQVLKLQDHYRDSVASKIAKTNIQTPWENSMRLYFSGLEQQILAGLTRLLDTSIVWLTRILGKQKAAYYKPKDGGDLSDENKVGASWCV